MDGWDGVERRRYRWTDERMDDLATLVRQNDERVTALQMLVAAHDLQLIEMKREQLAKNEHSFTMKVAIVSAMLVFILSEVATLVTVLTKLP